MRGIYSGAQWKRDGGMDGGRARCREREREKGRRHVIICRSSTSPVNPRSRLTWLIKGAIKGPPPEILRERREWRRERRKQARLIERRPNGRKERKQRKAGSMGGKWGKSVVIFVIVSYVKFPSRMGFIDAFFLFHSACIIIFSDHFCTSAYLLNVVKQTKSNHLEH